ncbi:hypothetical protein HMPREF1146_0524 [Prevotella sp. MSX73]|nr:hypothetical protein HMPREF1146_0524 [Prevotella sp. MSX73]
MITENAERVRSECTGRNVEHAWQQFTGNLVHVRYHEQQALGGCECSGQGTGLQRTVNGTGRTTLGLHFLNADSLAPKVLTPTGRPLVNMLRHRR